MSNLDLNRLPPDLQATLSRKETDGERRARLAKDLVVFGLALVVVVAAFGWSGWIMIRQTASADDKHTAQTILIALVSGLLGYLLKR